MDESFSEEVSLHDLPVCERPAPAGVVSPNSSMLLVSSTLRN